MVSTPGLARGGRLCNAKYVLRLLSVGDLLSCALRYNQWQYIRSDHDDR